MAAPIPENENEEAEIIAGNEAAAVLAHPALQKVFDRLKRKVEAVWANSSPGEHEKRENAHQLLTAIRLVEGELQGAVDTGKLAAKQKEVRAQQKAISDEDPS